MDKSSTKLLVTVLVIWLCVVVISIFAPDLVSGSQQEHLPLAAFSAWLPGSIATMLVLGAKRKGFPETNYLTIAVGVSIIWIIATIVSIWGPVMVTGSDPTRLPIYAIAGPIAGAVLTGIFLSVTELLNTDSQKKS